MAVYESLSVAVVRSLSTCRLLTGSLAWRRKQINLGINLIYILFPSFFVLGDTLSSSRSLCLKMWSFWSVAWQECYCETARLKHNKSIYVNPPHSLCGMHSCSLLYKNFSRHMRMPVFIKRKLSWLWWFGVRTRLKTLGLPKHLWSFSYQCTRL